MNPGWLSWPISLQSMTGRLQTGPFQDGVGDAEGDRTTGGDGDAEGDRTPGGDGDAEAAGSDAEHDATTSVVITATRNRMSGKRVA
jgi:hypothetical protein